VAAVATAQDLDSLQLAVEVAAQEIPHPLRLGHQVVLGAAVVILEMPAATARPVKEIPVDQVRQPMVVVVEEPAALVAMVMVPVQVVRVVRVIPGLME
jgi:hypothetical protein